jgi:DNA-binding winged helix-turn-helix (wHTH) protein/tetratricopeptide (TPR) repeat protein
VNRPGGQTIERRESAAVFRFGAFELDPSLYALRHAGSKVDVQPKVLDLLIHLAKHTDRVVSKEEILETLWPGVTATDDVLSRAIHAARQAVGDDGGQQRVIETVRGRGFRFVAAVERLETEPSASVHAPTLPEDPPGGIPFVGRTQALLPLQAALDEAKHGRGRIVLVAGEAGIGKTRLLEEFARDAIRNGTRVSTGWCWDGDGAPPYWPWVQVLRHLVSTSEPEELRAQLGRGAIDIARLVPGLRDKLPELPELPPAGSEQERFRLFDNITRFFRRAADRNTPHLLILDDLQWADRPSLRLIEFLAHELSGIPLLLLGAYQDQVLEPGHPLLETLGELARHPSCERRYLKGLTQTDVAQILEASGGDEPTAELVNAVCEKTDGNPFLVTEIAQLVKSDPAAFRIDSNSGAILSLPRGVTDVVHRRLSALSPQVREALAVAAVVGREFTYEILDRVLGKKLEIESLERALRSGIVTEMTETPARYRFSHALIREALYDEIGTAHRAQLHRKVAEALAEMQGVSPEANPAAIASHFAAAATPAEYEKSIAFATRAGESANEQLAYEDAANHFKDALDALEQREVQTAHERGQLLLAMADSHRRAGDLTSAREALAQVAKLARHFNMPKLLARAALGVKLPFTTLSGSIDAMEVALLEEALSVAPEGDDLLRAKLLHRLAFALYWSDDMKRCLDLSEEAIAIARKSGQPGAIAEALYSKGYVLAHPNTTTGERLRIVNEAVSHADESGDSELVFVCHGFRLWELLVAGDFAGGAIELRTMERMAHDLRQPLAVWYVTAAKALEFLFEGRIMKAEEAGTAARRLEDLLGDATTEHVHFVGSVQLYALRREQARLESYVDEVQQLADSNRPGSLWSCALANVLGYIGREEEARERFESLGARDFSGISLDDGWLVSMHHLTEICSRLEDGERAAQLYRQLAPFNGKMVSLGFGAFHGPVARYLGLLAATSGHWEEAVQHFEDAIETCRKLNAVIWRVRIQGDYARNLIRRPNSAEQEQGLALARQVIEEAGTLESKALEIEANSLL